MGKLIRLFFASTIFSDTIKMVEDENKGISDRHKKIAAITLLSASVAFVASLYLTAEEETHIFVGASDERELHKIWKEYNRANHPDKCSLEGEELEEHMKEYHDTKKLYEELKLNF